MMLVLSSNRAAMSRKSKWIEAKALDEPASKVARRALRARLRTVWEWLPQAADESETDAEYVHQLRVSTRRATAALRLFESQLAGKRARWFRKRLKRIRKAAGEARDLDVLAQRVTAICNAEQTPGCASLLDRIATERRAAQPAIREIYRRLRNRGFQRRLRRFTRRIARPSKEAANATYLEAARRGLEPLLTAFFLAGEQDLESTPALHEFRIAGKRLRYAMEVFASAFGPAFRKELYPIVE